MQIIAINKYDPAAPDINSMADLPEDQRIALHDFFKNYKIAEGKAFNSFYMPKEGDEGSVWLDRTMTNQVSIVMGRHRRGTTETGCTGYIQA